MNSVLVFEIGFLKGLILVLVQVGQVAAKIVITW